MSKKLEKKLWIKTHLQENSKGLPQTAVSKANEAVDNFRAKFGKKNKQKVQSTGAR
jgi:hypothetical protein